MTKTEFELAMDQVQELTNLIAEYKSKEDRDTSNIFLGNWVSRTNVSFLEFVQAYDKLFEIYKKFDQGDTASDLRDKADNLLNDLFAFVDSCDEFSYLVGLRLLLVVGKEITWLHSVNSEVRQATKERLEKIIWRTLFNHFDPAFGIIATKAPKKPRHQANKSRHLSALELLWDLSDSADEKAEVDRQLCTVMELATRFNIAYQNLPMAEQWLRWAAEIAQDRLKDRNLSGQFLEGASQIHQAYSQQHPSKAYIRAIQADPTTPEYAEAMQELSIEDSLNVIVQKDFERQHQERFLTPVQQIVEDYQNIDDFFETLATDKRFRLDLSQIKERADRYEESDLIGQPLGVDYDTRDNPRREMSPRESVEYRFTLQMLDEIYKAVVEVMRQSNISREKITKRISESNLSYDWGIFTVGIDRFVNKDFVSASHILTIQFENIFREVLRANGLPVKNIGGTPGDLPLNKLVEKEYVREFIGNDLAETIDWFMTRSYGRYNYRHKIAHGWIDAKECNYDLCCLAIWLTLTALEFMESRKINDNTPAN